MTEQLFSEEGNSAEFSVEFDMRYRYRLRRRWADGSGVLWVMLNPSTADGQKNDATLRRITNFSRDWGHGGLDVVNLYALVNPDPLALWRAEDPVGLENDAAIALAAQEARRVVVAWGNGAPHPDRVRTVTAVLRANMLAERIECLGFTQEGNPRHPVRLAASTPLETFFG